MARVVPTDRALSPADRSYLEGRGIHDGLIRSIDAAYPPSPEAPVFEAKTPEQLGRNYDEMNKEALMSELEKRGLSKTGNKPEVIARLREDDAKKAAPSE